MNVVLLVGRLTINSEPNTFVFYDNSSVKKIQHLVFLFFKSTLEEQKDKMLNFLDTTIIIEDESVRFRVYRKPTNKEDYIHFYSSHSMRTKSGIVIGFFLRAYRICSQEYLEAEIDHIFKVFGSLQYPKALLIKWKNKAKQILRKKGTENEKQKSSRRDERIVVIPHFKHFEGLSRGLRQAGIKLVAKAGTTIGDLVKMKEKKTRNENSTVYRVPCGGCHESYIGETSRGLKTRISEHTRRRDLRHHRLTNSMVLHARDEDHLPLWEKAEQVKTGLTKRHRKILESALIESVPCTNHRGGFYTLGTAVCHFAFQKYIKDFYT